MTLHDIRRALLSDREREQFEERAAIIEYHGGFTRRTAEYLALHEIKHARRMAVGARCPVPNRRKETQYA